MAAFFNIFPKILYDVNNHQYSNYETITDIMFRVRFIRETINNIYSYVPYTIRDGDTPERLANKVYGTSEAHWMILYANDIIDPQYDWPLDGRSFRNYIVEKYRHSAAAALSISATLISDTQILAWTKTNNHHYEKVIKYNNSQTNTVTEARFVIDKEQLSDDSPGPQYETYDDFAPYQLTYNVDGATILETGERVEVSIYDWELAQNEAKREIKIIKKEYYNQCLVELKRLTGMDVSVYRRVNV